MRSAFKNPLVIIALVIIIDQAIKLWVKSTMMLGQEYHVAGNWFILHFTENNGMAFGMEFGGEAGKLFLSLFRIVAIGALGYYVFVLLKKGAPSGFVASMALIFSGATGNLIDSVFYGKVFGSSYGRIAEWFPADGGYAPFLQGKVVDMFYFPVIEGHFPEWFPIWGSEEFIFFRPVFNFADFAISTGVFLILINQKTFFAEPVKETAKPEEANSDHTISESQPQQTEN